MRSVHQMGLSFRMRIGAKFEYGTLEFRNPVSPVNSTGSDSISGDTRPSISLRNVVRLESRSESGYKRTWLVGASRRAIFMYALGEWMDLGNTCKR